MDNDTLKKVDGKHPRAAKDIFTMFVYSNKSFDCFPVVETYYKKTSPLSFDEHAISICNYLYYRMFQNRLLKECNFQEVVKVSYSQIAKNSRVPIETVKRLVPYLIGIKLIKLIDGGGKSKRMGTYCAGDFIHELYPQN